MNNFFLRSFLILSWLVGISFSANAQDKTISYAAIDTHTKNYTDPDPPIVPGCDTTYLYSYLTNVTSASLTIQWTHVAPSIYGIPAPLSYELQLTDAQNNAIGLPITKAAPVLYSGQVGVNISETFNGLQPNTLYKIKIRQLCNLSPAPNQWSEYVTRSMTTLDVNNCNIFTGITASTTLSQYSIMIDVKTKPINSGIPYTIKIENLRGQKVYEAIFITGTPPFPSYFEVNSLDACTTYIVSASVNNCPIGMTTQVTTRCCGDIITAKIEELLPASLTVSWQNNSSQNFIPESYNLILQEKNPDGTYGDISTKSVDFSIGVIANGSVKFLETLNDLDPNKEYRVEIVPVCDACPNNSFQSANVKSKSTTEPCEEFGTPQYAEKQDCAAGGNLVFSSIQSTALTVNFNQIPASKQRKYFVKIIEKSTNTLIQGEWIIPNTNNAEVLSHTFVNLKENTDYRAELISYCCSTLDAENHCVWAIIPSDVKKEAKTGKDLCKAPTEYSIKTKTASTLTVQWKNNEAKLKRFVVQITDGAYFNASKEIIASGQLNQALETVFDNLEPGQKYVIKINAQCCKSLTNDVCNVWEDGALITFDAETESIKPIECTKTPTVFTFTPNGNSVDITWTPAGEALAHDARRFIVYYENKTVVIDDASKASIKDLEKGKNYAFQIREVFDGFGPKFTSACDMQKKDISLADPCESDFQASVKCAGIGSILISLNKKLPQKSKLGMKKQ